MLPGVHLTEYDYSQVPQYSTQEVGFFMGTFEKGPVNVPISITSTSEFKTIFGRGIGIFKNDWYQVYNYLQYSSAIIVIRVVGSETCNSTSYSTSFATNNKSIYNPGQDLTKIQFNSDDDYHKQYSSLILENDVFIGATSPGEAGDLLEVFTFDRDLYEKNDKIHLTNDEFLIPKNIIEYMRDGEIAIIVTRNGSVREIMKYTATQLYSRNFNIDSSYVYCKFGQLKTTPTKYNPKGNDSIRVGSWKLDRGATFIPTPKDLIIPTEIAKSKVSLVFDNFIANENFPNLCVEIANERRDCLVFIGLPTMALTSLCFDEEIPLSSTSHKVQDWHDEHGDVFVINMSDMKWTYSSFKSYVDTITRSDFVVLINNSKWQYDKFSNTMQSIGLAGDMAGLKAQASKISPFIPGAGTAHGHVKNLSSLVVNWDKSHVSEMADNGINHISLRTILTQFTYSENLQFNDRIMVRSLFNHLERSVENFMRTVVFDFIDNETIIKVRQNIEGILDEAIVSGGLLGYDINIEKDDKSSTSNVADTLIIDIILQPSSIVEVVELRIINDGIKNL